jgi:hypothetical protein
METVKCEFVFVLQQFSPILIILLRNFNFRKSKEAHGGQKGLFFPQTLELYNQSSDVGELFC